MKNKKILRKGLFLTLGLGVAAVAITAIAASCNNKKSNNKKSNKEKAIEYLESKLNEIISKLDDSIPEEYKGTIMSSIEDTRSSFRRIIEKELEESGLNDISDEAYNDFKDALSSSLKIINNSIEIIKNNP